MFSKKERVKKKKEFERVFKEGENFNNSFFILKKITNKFSFSRFAFIAPSKIFKKAVEKNKTKRKIKENIKDFEIKKGFDIIIIAKTKIDKVNIKENIKDILEKAELI